MGRYKPVNDKPNRCTKCFEPIDFTPFSGGLSAYCDNCGAKYCRANCAIDECRGWPWQTVRYVPGHFERAGKVIDEFWQAVASLLRGDDQ